MLGCPHCACGPERGWIETDNNGPILPCPICNVRASIVYEKQEKLATENAALAKRVEELEAANRDIANECGRRLKTTNDLRSRVEELEAAYKAEELEANELEQEGIELQRRVERLEKVLRPFKLIAEPHRPRMDSVMVANGIALDCVAALEDK